MKPRQEQFSGSLIGQCLGDALGFVVEGEPRFVCVEHVKSLNAGLEVARGRYPFAIGQYTDDSQLARELLQSYVACGEFSPEDYADRISAIFLENRIVGRGRATEEAAKRLAKGVHWEEAGTPSPSAGNGSAMRAGPVGLLFYDNPEMLIKVSYDQGRITHQDSRCSAGALAVAGAVALALKADSGSIDAHSFIDKLSGWAKELDDSVSSAILQLKELLPLPRDVACGIINVIGKDAGSLRGVDGISPFVTSSVLWSLYSFLKDPSDYWGVICRAIAGGGDVDTTAAMAGAISGAYSGLEAVPAGFAARLTDQGGWGFVELVNLANRCYALKMGQ